MRVLIVFLLLFCFTEAKEFTIASYNVQNLFDLKTDGTEYKQYNPKINKNWNKNSQKIKLNNVKKVLADLDANIIALQEIESKQALKDLLQLLPQYPYHAFLKNSQSAVGLALLSKFPIETSKKISIQTHKNYSRPILEVSIRIDNRLFYVFINHWRSKKAPESFRIDYANSLKNRLKELPAKIDYIVLGDLNSNYNERETLKFDKKLNDTFGITGINDVLMDPLMLINLWHELPYSKRFSYRYKGQNTTPDHIVVTKNLFDNQGISYVDNSFKVFKPYYLYKNKKITSWKFEKLTRHEKIHGYSDHLPIIATFSTQPFVKKNFSQKKNTIEYLYTQEKLAEPIFINNALVIYKHENSAVVKQKEGRSIWVYNCAKDLKYGFEYQLLVSKIDRFNGLKEITRIDKKIPIASFSNIEKYYLDASTIDLFNERYQNEIITNFKGVFKKGYLHFKNKKIKLYAKNKKLLPKNGQKVIIHRAHLSIFRSKVQLVIYKQSDIDVI